MLVTLIFGGNQDVYKRQALTRAEKRVIMTYSTSRYKNGNVVYPQPSRFIAEIDPHYLDGFFTPARPSMGRSLHGPGIQKKVARPNITLQPKVCLLYTSGRVPLEHHEMAYRAQR